MTAPTLWNGKAERDERALRITAVALLHGLSNMLSVAFILGAGAFEYGAYTFIANTVLTIFFLYAYFEHWRRSSLNELMLLEALGVAIFFTLGAGYLINRGVWLLVMRPL